LKAFGTFQVSYLLDYHEDADLLAYDSTAFQTRENKSTPRFYGGANANYHPFTKLNVNVSLYAYSKQTYKHDAQTNAIDPKAIVNLKVAYNFWKNNSVYLNARNLLGIERTEFGFSDPIGGLYMVGLRLAF